MGQEYVMKSIGEIEELAKQEGLDFFPTVFEYVNQDIMLEACSYGLPVRARHWSYGRSYDHQKIYGEMGLSKVYEIVFNNDPSYAFLLNTNPDIINIMVGAHVFGHVHFFKHNVMFKNSDRNMVHRAAERASRIDEYIEKYGLDRVEHLMDIGFALDNHIDWNKGVFRKKYPKKKIIEERVKSSEFGDLLNPEHNSGRSIRYRTVGDRFPPHPEKDLLWFLSNYAPLDEWEKDVLGIIREESYYFYPIVQTKIANEGFACVLKDTPIYTHDGIVTMEEVVSNGNGTVYDGESNQMVVHSGVFHNRDVIEIRTQRGLILGGASNHRILSSSNEWVQLDELSVGDTIRISGGNNMWAQEEVKLNFKLRPKAQSAESLCRKYGLSHSTYIRHKNKSHQTKSKNIDIIQKIDDVLESEKTYISCMGNRQDVIFPQTVSPEVAEIIGYLVGDGHVSKKGRHFGLTTGDESQADRFMNLIERTFGVKTTKRWDDSSKNGRWRVNGYSLSVLDFFDNIFGIKSGIGAKFKKIPEKILRSPKYVMSAFLRAYYDCDGCASKDTGIILSTASDELARQVQVVLLNYNILSTRHVYKKINKETKKTHWCWQLRTTGGSAKIFCDEIGFGLKRKQENLQKYIENGKWFKKEKWTDKVVDIRNCGKQDVYDISVTDTHRYAAAGFINHNSFWHAELMYKYDKVSENDHIEFCRCHSGVVNPGNPFQINPYYLGFKVFTDIRERWDALHQAGKSDITGIQKVIQVADEEDDASFLRNYLTKELAEEMGLFNFGYRHKREPGKDEDQLDERYGIIELKDRDLEKVIDNITRPTLNYGAPLIVIDKVDGDTLVLSHKDNFGSLDENYTEKTMGYIYELWGGPIELGTHIDENKVVFCFDESGFDIL